MTVEIVKKLYSKKDVGVIKYALDLGNGNVVEAVLASFESNPLCISCQVGCQVKCIFCETGKGAFGRNLTKNELVKEISVIMRDAKKSDKRAIDTIAFMGMGEPLLNYDNVVGAIRAVHRKYPKMTFLLATAGVVPGIYSLALEGLPINLYLSLHSASDSVRKKLVPNLNYTVKSLFDSIQFYSKNAPISQPVGINYLLLNNINDKKKDALTLVDLIKDGPFVVHLKKYCITTHGLNKTTDKKIRDFSGILEKNGIHFDLRNSLGQDIFAGCGQLRKGFIKKNRSNTR